MLIRKCIACGKNKIKTDFIRICRTPKIFLEIKITVLNVGESKYLDGRSAYICDDLKCINRIKKSRRLEKVFSCKISDEIYEKISSFVFIKK
ncbi:MAG: YlxR family protein [Oscillospiraceae bacterium]|jgi:predicted RNA-binding protein YlxR (DUF448 family)|nr:YlxR family protein [Oscillospiraceae bacterium]